MHAYMIEVDGGVRESFSYDRPLNTQSEKALTEYAVANYGPDAMVRRMTKREAADFMLHGPQFFVKKS